jgi:hypothetical protein
MHGMVGWSGEGQGEGGFSSFSETIYHINLHIRLILAISNSYRISYNQLAGIEIPYSPSRHKTAAKTPGVFTGG